MDKIILIGGAPTIGKSYVAKKLSKSLGLPWISTDMLREQMRKIVRKEDYPNLFFFMGTNPKKYLRKYNAAEIVEHQNMESMEVWKSVRALVETDYVWGSFIIEGVAILPSLVKRLMKSNKKIKPIFLIDPDVKHVRKTIYSRGLWDDANKYPDSVKEKEVEWVLEFNDYIRKETEKCNFQTLSISSHKNLVKNIRELLN